MALGDVRFSVKRVRRFPPSLLLIQFDNFTVD
jgi:hypothetical protein